MCAGLGRNYSCLSSFVWPWLLLYSLPGIQRSRPYYVLRVLRDHVYRLPPFVVVPPYHRGEVVHDRDLILLLIYLQQKPLMYI